LRVISQPIECEAAKLASELQKRFPEATLTINLSVPIIAAAAALSHGEPARAVELLEPVRPYDHAPSAEFWSRYLRGQAYLQLKNGQAAGSEFQSIVDRQGEVPAALLYAPAHLGLARSKALMNDATGARRAYERLFDLWKSPDPQLKPLEEARVEYARLQ
jgi:tetratricopeptide (TPR) repeat protein